ncbi:hypothetical protein [Streptomyces sp. NPDC054865]
MTRLMLPAAMMMRVGFDAGHAVRLAQADPAATTALAAWLDPAAAVKSGRA